MRAGFHTILTALLINGSAGVSIGAEVGSFGQMIDSMPVQSWIERRGMGIAKQKFDYSCGAASLVNIIKYYYGVNTDELEIIGKIGIKQAFSMSDLAQAAEQYGFKPVGLAVNYETLMKFQRPVIVYLDYWDDGHFSVLRSIDRHGVWLADPAWGNTRLRRERFERFWRTRDNAEAPGRVLVLLPKPGTKVSINDAFLAAPQGGAGIVPPHPIP